ncbi:hypothetical protein C8Q76DRAFT_604827 [Earliella scabrosa]|nr:hypothetical protein C8Q76DRAFT_604827 [Earliella scabrosa]
MLCNAAAWFWLLEHCSSQCREVISNLIQDPHHYAQSTNWFERLATQVYNDVKSRRRGEYRRSHFLSHLPGDDLVGVAPRPHVLEDDITSRVCKCCVEIVRTWLRFPSNKEMVAGYFVIYVVGSFKNIDVLLLSGVWRAYIHVPSKVLGVQKRAALLKLDMLREFEHGLNAIVQFTLEMLPVARGVPIAQPTSLQKLALDRPDHYLPFRELAPCRRRVTGPGGPFHTSIIDAPGAFPSCVIFRALLFDSPVLHHDTLCYFASYAAWESFLQEQQFDPDSKESRSRFFNLRCYGSAQAQRVHGHKFVSAYFDAESGWRQLVQEHHGHPIPFTTFLLWTQGKKQVEAGQRRRRLLESPPHLPLLGKLTGYLLTADLVYAKKVARPSAEEVAHVVHSNNLGSLKGLVTAHLAPQQPTLEQVTQAFLCVYKRLRDVLKDDLDAIVFDEIMVEHLLCKFQRTSGA